MRTLETAELVQVDRALESSRDSGYDLTAAAGEIVDNSIEGKAKTVRIRTYWEDGRRRRIDRIAFADDGIGIEMDTLAHALSLGFSTRYGSRAGIGRFGVGLKLATLSQARRVDVYTKPSGDGRILHTFLDLDMVASGAQTRIEATVADSFPGEHADLMDGEDEEFESGTLVVWSKVDRLVQNKSYGEALDARIAELRQFLARAYRLFIDGGVTIELNGRRLWAHDPLFLLPNPRVTRLFGDVRAEVVDEHDFVIDGHPVHVTVTLLPEVFRRTRGEGGTVERAGEEFKDLHIPYNEGRISFMRQGREINYDLVAKMLPGGVHRLDRFVGIEVRFPAALDEYFQVRNVKRGAVPVDKLREELRLFLRRAVQFARRQIRSFWQEQEVKEAARAQAHQAAQEAAMRADETLPRGRAGEHRTSDEDAAVLDGLTTRMLGEDASDAERTSAQERLREWPFSIVDDGWPGRELMVIHHLNGRAIIQLNHEHPFVRDFYDPLKTLAARDASEIDPQDAVDGARRLHAAIDALLIGYAKAENMHPSPDKVYGDLRSDWGRYAAAILGELR